MTLLGEELADESSDPLSAVRVLGRVAGDEPTLLVLENFHRFVDSAEICQAVLTQLQLGKQLGRHIVVLPPVVKLPLELDRQFVVLQHALPDREQLWEIAESLVGAFAVAGGKGPADVTGLGATDCSFFSAAIRAGRSW